MTQEELVRKVAEAIYDSGMHGGHWGDFLDQSKWLQYARAAIRVIQAEALKSEVDGLKDVIAKLIVWLNKCAEIKESNSKKLNGATSEVIRLVAEEDAYEATIFREMIGILIDALSQSKGE